MSLLLLLLMLILTTERGEGELRVCDALFELLLLLTAPLGMTDVTN